MRRPPLWRRKYLIESRVQITVTLYFVVYSLIGILCMHLGLKLGLNAIFSEAERFDSGNTVLMQQVHQSAISLLNKVLLITGGMTFAFMLGGGILISHRLVGPIYRLRALMRQVIAGEDPQPLQVRKYDFFHDLFPLFQEMLQHLKSKERREAETTPSSDKAES